MTRVPTQLDAEIIAVIAAHMTFESADLTSASRLDDLGIESIDLVDLLFLLEERFGREFPEFSREGVYLGTIGDIATVVSLALGDNASALHPTDDKHG